jgi:hypothetical protein
MEVKTDIEQLIREGIDPGVDGLCGTCKKRLGKKGITILPWPERIATRKEIEVRRDMARYGASFMAICGLASGGGTPKKPLKNEYGPTARCDYCGEMKSIMVQHAIDAKVCSDRCLWKEAERREEADG